MKKAVGIRLTAVQNFKGQKFNGTRQQSRRGGNKAVERRREACAAKLRGRSDEIVVVTVYTYYS